MTQEQALRILKSGQSVYLTGAAGSGKTYVLNKFIRHLRKRKIGVGITASTGIAATHLGGITIHSWAGMGIAKNPDAARMSAIVSKPHIERRFNNARVLIIDEISMLDAGRLDLVNEIAKAAKENASPFGGMQVVLCGDFFQLPPVAKEDEPPSLFAYRSQAWNELNPAICYLTEQHRQGNDALTAILNAVRGNRVSDVHRNHLHSRRATMVGKGQITRLYSHNIDVDAQNDLELAKLPHGGVSFHMMSRGVPALVAALKNGCLAPEVLMLKKGATVMFVKNNFDKGWVNGTLGTVEDFDGEGDPIVRGLNGQKFYATRETWKIEENGKVAASITQIPLRLAWAMTIHKSQGMTLDAAEIDLSDAFERGMGYVALSRVKSLAGMRLLGFNETALQVHEDILAFDKVLQEKSQAYESL